MQKYIQQSILTEYKNLCKTHTTSSEAELREQKPRLNLLQIKTKPNPRFSFFVKNILKTEL